MKNLMLKVSNLSNVSQGNQRAGSERVFELTASRVISLGRLRKATAALDSPLFNSRPIQNRAFPWSLFLAHFSIDVLDNDTYVITKENRRSI